MRDEAAFKKKINIWIYSLYTVLIQVYLGIMVGLGAGGPIVDAGAALWDGASLEVGMAAHPTLITEILFIVYEYLPLIIGLVVYLLGYIIYLCFVRNKYYYFFYSIFFIVAYSFVVLLESAGGLIPIPT